MKYLLIFARDKRSGSYAFNQYKIGTISLDTPFFNILSTSTLFVPDQKISPVIQYLPIQESELQRLNEISNMPDISGIFETLPPIPMEATELLYRQIVNGIVSLWGIHLDEQMIGGAGFFVYPPGTRLSHTATFFIFLEPDYWGQGIGRRSIEFLEDIVRTRGYYRMECMVVIHNTKAIRLYELMGFNREGIKQKAYLYDGEFTDLLIMGKILA